MDIHNKMYVLSLSSACFGAYCAIFRENFFNFFVFSKLLSQKVAH